MGGRKIQFSNLPALDSFNSALLMNNINKTYDKLAKKLHQQPFLSINFKEQAKTGSRRKFFVRLHCSVAGLNLVAKEEGWRVVSTTQKALGVLERETAKHIKKK